MKHSLPVMVALVLITDTTVKTVFLRYLTFIHIIRQSAVVAVKILVQQKSFILSGMMNCIVVLNVLLEKQEE